MRTRYYLNITITFLLLALLCSCHRHHDVPLHPALQRADSLMQQHPDSALALLSRFNSRSFKDRYQQEAYRVLLVQANDRCYQPIVLYKKDMANAVSYFDSIGDVPAMQSKAHYYLGRIYQDSGNPVETVKAFVAALNYAEKVKDTFLQCSIKGNLGYILWENDLFDDAESMYKEVVRLGEKRHYYDILAVAYLKLGDIAIQKYTKDSSIAEKYLNKGLAVCSRIKNPYIQNAILCSLSTLYSNTNRYKEAILCAKESQGCFLDSIQLYHSYLILGKVYSDAKQYDSALWYINKSLLSSDIDLKKQSFEILIAIAKNLKDKDKVIYYQDKYNTYNDSLQNNNSSIEITKQIQDGIKKQIEVRYTMSNKRNVVYLVSLIFFILVISIAYIVYQRRQKRNAIGILDSANRKKDQTIERLHAEIDDDIRRKQEYETMAPLIIKFRNHPIYNKIINTIDQNTHCQNVQEKTLLSDAEWKEFQGQIDDIFPGFISRLKSPDYLLTNQDISFCCLVRLEFKYSDIASVFGCSPQAITKRKKRIFNQLGVDSTHAFEEILKNL